MNTVSDPRFGLPIGTEYFGTGLFWRTILGYFGVTAIL